MSHWLFWLFEIGEAPPLNADENEEEQMELSTADMREGTLALSNEDEEKENQALLDNAIGYLPENTHTAQEMGRSAERHSESSLHVLH